MSRRQQQILEFIRQSVQSRGFPPSIREIGEAVGLSSSSTVHSHLRSLETKGYLRRNPSKPRSIELLDGPKGTGIRLVEIPVGVGSDPDGNKRTISLPLELVGNRESFLFPVDSEKYRDEAIMPGDLVIVNRGSSGAREGDMVLTDDGDRPTLCRFTNGNRATEGRADLEILGRVVGVIRKFPEV